MKRAILAFLVLISPRPLIAEPPPGYNLVFDARFQTDLSKVLSPGVGWGPITIHQWIEHTPYGGDFGWAYFTGPDEPNGDGTGKAPPNPFVSWCGSLGITAYMDAVINHWRSGMIASVDTNGNGFSQALGYWETAMKLPAGQGVWPAFWLAGLNGVFPNRTTNSAEIDVAELYGVDMTKLHCNLHDWTPAGKDVGPAGSSTTVTVSGVNSGWHVYGCLVNADFIHWFFDGLEVWQTATPTSAKLPLYCMVDFALGGGWPINMPSPNYMYISYVRCYSPP
jgi:hypothetical protein